MRYELMVKTLDKERRKLYASERYVQRAFRVACIEWDNIEVSVFDTYDNRSRKAHMEWRGP